MNDQTASTDTEPFDYQGTELEIFLHAENWKRYFLSRIRPYIRGRVLEVAAGMGGTTRVLCSGSEERWVCLEPDGALLSRLAELKDRGEIPSVCEPLHGTTEVLGADDTFDTIIYIDVLEHIEDDKAEAARAVAHLADGGALIVVGPAHQFLFSPFDQAIGHFRRYSLRMLADMVRTFTDSGELRQRRLEYLDSVGFFASLANRLLLKQSNPTLKQILFWDRVLVRLSRVIDPLLFHRAGKSVVGVWTRAVSRHR